MSQLNSNTESLQEILATVNALPDAGAGGGATTWDDLGSTWGNGTVLAENTPIFVEDQGMFAIFEPVREMTTGGEYTVNWNGTEYTCIAEDYIEEDVQLGWMLGNTSVLGGTQENESPFVLILVAAAMDDGLYGFAVPLDGATELTLSITGYTKIITPVPAKYLGEVRGQQKIVIDPASSYASIPLDIAWEMDMGELQSAITVIYNDAEFAVSDLWRSVSTNDFGERRAISFVFAEGATINAVEWWGWFANGIWASSNFNFGNNDGETYIYLPEPHDDMPTTRLSPQVPMFYAAGVRATWFNLTDYSLSHITLSSPSGKNFRVTVDDNGVLTATQV